MNKRKELSLVLTLIGIIILSNGFMYTAWAETRFSASSDNVIYDKDTALEWIVGPDEPFTYNRAEAWVKGCQMAGGGWRMPTFGEIRDLYLNSFFSQTRSDAADEFFKTKGWAVWAQPVKEWQEETPWRTAECVGIRGYRKEDMWLVRDYRDTSDLYGGARAWGVRDKEKK
jgi:hypothetical protein